MTDNKLEAGASLTGDPPIDISSIAESVAQVIEMFGIGSIVLSAILASLIFSFGLYQEREFDAPFRRYRKQLGRGLLLGLELLIAADIIGTVAVDPTFRNLGMLALIVLIRTFLSFSLSVEINGRWPWQPHSQSGL